MHFRQVGISRFPVRRTQRQKIERINLLAAEKVNRELGGILKYPLGKALVYTRIFIASWPNETMLQFWQIASRSTQSCGVERLQIGRL